RRHTRLQGDWSSDVCSSDLPLGGQVPVILPPSPSYVVSKFGEPVYMDGGDPFDVNGGCELDGVPWDCNDLQRRLAGGSATVEKEIGRASCRERGWDCVVGGG